MLKFNNFTPRSMNEIISLLVDRSGMTFVISHFTSIFIYSHGHERVDETSNNILA